MKASVSVVLFATVALGACGRSVDATKHAPSGRFAGVGIYPADRTWTKMSAVDKPADKSKATASDDQFVIVVVDSNTGEMRQCGNMSGYCIGMNPWTRALGKPQTNPVDVTEHAPEKTVDRAGAAETVTTNEVAPSDMDHPRTG